MHCTFGVGVGFNTTDKLMGKKVGPTQDDAGTSLLANKNYQQCDQHPFQNGMSPASRSHGEKY